MKNNKFLKLLVFSIEQSLRQKMFVVFNILLLLGSVIALNFGTILDFFNTDKSEEYKLFVYDETNSYTQKISNYEIEEKNKQELKDLKLNEDEILIEIYKNKSEGINVIISSTDYVEGDIYTYISEKLEEVRTNELANNYGITSENVQNINKEINIERIIISKETTLYDKYEFLIYVVGMFLYFILIFIISAVSSGIGFEKTSKATEYMLTGISDNQYLWYNILKVNIVMFIQGILIILYSLLATTINGLLKISTLETSANLGDLISLNFGEIGMILGYVFIQIIFTVLILSLLQAIFTSRVSNLSEISNSLGITMSIVIVMVLVLPNIITKYTDISIWIQLLSILPCISVTLVPKLMLLGEISNTFIILSIVLNCISVLLLSTVGARYFKKGLLGDIKQKESKKEATVEVSNYINKRIIFKIFFTMIIVFALTNILTLFTVFITNKTLLSVAQIVIFALGFYLPYLYLNDKNSKENIKLKNTRKRNNLTYIFITFPIALIIQFISGYITSKLGIESDITSLMNYDFNTWYGIVLFLVQIALLPAIFEELLFRKAFISRGKKLGKLNICILSSLCFALMHLNFTQGIFAFFMGIVLCYITLESGSIIPAMVIHFINNLFSGITTILGEGIYSNMLLILIIVISVLGLIKLSRTKLDFNGYNLSDLKVISKSIFTEYIAVFALLMYVIYTIYVQLTIF